MELLLDINKKLDSSQAKKVLEQVSGMDKLMSPMHCNSTVIAPALHMQRDLPQLPEFARQLLSAVKVT